MTSVQWTSFNPTGTRRVLVTKELPGTHWLEILTQADCRVDVCSGTEVLSPVQIIEAMGSRCHGVIGQLAETWDASLFSCLKSAGGKVYSNYAVGFNNIDLESATCRQIAVGNTPGVLTEATAELAVALTFAAARRIGESERFIRGGQFTTWLPTLFLGKRLWRKRLGIIGAGRIGTAYAKMMVEGHKMDLIYYNRSANTDLEAFLSDYNRFLRSRKEREITWKRAKTVDQLLKEADCVSIHTPLTPDTHHLIDGARLSLMKSDAILINTSRGPVIDEAALVAHCRDHSDFRVGLDVFENEPKLTPGLDQLDNVVMVPHIGSATKWTRNAMATLAAHNVAAILMGYPVWSQSDILPFLKPNPPKAAPSILNAAALGLPILGGH